MIPIRDDHRAPGAAVVCLSIVALCALAFWRELMLPVDELQRMIARFGLVPELQSARLAVIRAEFPAVPPGAWLEFLTPYVSSLFLHGGLDHLLGNLWFLWVFGHNVEARFGRLGFLAFYLGCGAVAGVIHSVVMSGVEVQRPVGPFHVEIVSGGSIPTIGASGAIAGVLGAYFVLFPRARVLTFLPPFFFLVIPAVAFLALWFLLQWWGANVGFGGAFSGVAYWAHVGGFATGMVVAILAMTIHPARFVARDWRLPRRF